MLPRRLLLLLLLFGGEGAKFDFVIRTEVTFHCSSIMLLFVTTWQHNMFTEQ